MSDHVTMQGGPAGRSCGGATPEGGTDRAAFGNSKTDRLSGARAHPWLGMDPHPPRRTGGRAAGPRCSTAEGEGGEWSQGQWLVQDGRTPGNHVTAVCWIQPPSACPSHGLHFLFWHPSSPSISLTNSPLVLPVQARISAWFPQFRIRVQNMDG